MCSKIMLNLVSIVGPEILKSCWFLNTIVATSLWKRMTLMQRILWLYVIYTVAQEEEKKKKNVEVVWFYGCQKLLIFLDFFVLLAPDCSLFIFHLHIASSQIWNGCFEMHYPCLQCTQNLQLGSNEAWTLTSKSTYQTNLVSEHLSNINPKP